MKSNKSCFTTVSDSRRAANTHSVVTGIVKAITKGLKKKPIILGKLNILSVPAYSLQMTLRFIAIS